MSIVRVAKKDQPFTMIANSTLQDTRISLDAKGCLVWLLSKPEDWTVYKIHLQRTFGIGREKMDRIFTELQDHGYVRSERYRSADGTFQWAWIVYETPLSGKPATAEPATGKPSSTNKDLTKDRQTKSQPAEPADPSMIVKELTAKLGDAVEANGHARPKENAESWSAIDRLMRIDNKTPEEIAVMIAWSQASDFWSANIRSAVKLRKHFETMTAQKKRDESKAAKEQPAPPPPPTITEEELQAKREEWIRNTVPMPASVREAMRRR